MSTTTTQVGAIARRAVIRTSRQPASIIPPLIFPVALMLVNAGGLRSSTQLPGFPTDSFLAFALAVPFIQGALFSTMNAGTDIARDVAVRLREGLGLTDIVRAVDANGVDIADIELHAPTLDDVFLAKTGRTLEGAAEEAETVVVQDKRRR